MNEVVHVFKVWAMWQQLKRRERVMGPWSEMPTRKTGGNGLWQADTLERLNRKAQGHFPTEKAISP